MKIIVTGGAGFIGSHIVDEFIAAGHDVSVVDDLSTGFRQNLNPRARFYEMDIRDRTLAEVFAMEKPDIVCHQAARANVRESFEKPLLYADVNVVGSLNILECCRRSEVRKVVYASTGGAVYGEPEYLPVTEEHPVNPLDPYGASKHHVEHYLHLYRRNFSLDFTVLRYPNVYGPRQSPYGEAGVVAIFASKMLRGVSPTINGDGEQERDFVHVSDVARANVLSLENGGGQLLNIGSGNGTSVNTIYERLAALTGFSGQPIISPAKAGEVRRIFLDSTRAQHILGWRTNTSLTDGLRSTVAFFRSAS
jgi:UDP-glucose 4-epimerase